MKKRRVFVTGLGIVSSIGNNCREVLNALSQNQHGFERVDFYEGEDCPIKVAGTIKGFSFPSTNYLQWRAPEGRKIPRTLARGLPPHGFYCYCALEEALEDAGLDVAELADTRTGLYCASAGSPYLQKEFLNEMDRHKGSRGNPMGVVSTISGTLNFNFSNYLGIRGSNCGFVSACSSSAHAIGAAMDEIRLGRQDRIIVLAGEDVQKETVLPFGGMRALTTNADPHLASRPFDREASGFVASGGGVCLILEAADTMPDRQEKNYVELTAWGQASDAFSTMASHPDGEGLSRAMGNCLMEADENVSTVDLISCHATSTRAGDKSEALAIRSLLEKQDCARSIPVTATKSLTGHTLSMSGALQAAIGCMSIANGIIPGNPGLTRPIEEASELDLVTRPRTKEIGSILSSSSGFGGSNVSILLRRSGWIRDRREYD